MAAVLVASRGRQRFFGFTRPSPCHHGSGGGFDAARVRRRCPTIYATVTVARRQRFLS
jgi:hypothetical protein